MPPWPADSSARAAAWRPARPPGSGVNTRSLERIPQAWRLSASSAQAHESDSGAASRQDDDGGLPTIQRMQDTLIVTCALTGAGPLSMSPAQPVTPRQIARSGLEAAEAVAAVLHVHVRAPQTGAFSGELALYEEAVGLIRAQNPEVILKLSTGLGSGFYPKDPLLPSEAGPGTPLWPAAQRVRMEDKAFIAKGEFAQRNAQQVRKVRRMVEAMGPTIATPAQARNILGLNA